MRITFLVAAVLIGADEKKKPLFATVDLDRGETVEVRLADGGKAPVKLVESRRRVTRCARPFAARQWPLKPPTARRPSAEARGYDGGKKPGRAEAPLAG